MRRRAARDRESCSCRSRDPAMGTGAVDGEDPLGLAVPGPEAEVRRERRPSVGAGDRASPAGRRLERRAPFSQLFRSELRTQWFPAPAARQLAEAVRPRCSPVSRRLRAANGGTLSGFFERVLPGASPARPSLSRPRSGRTGSRRLSSRFMEIALDFHPAGRSTIVEIPEPSHRTPDRQTATTAGRTAARRPAATGGLAPAAGTWQPAPPACPGWPWS